MLLVDADLQRSAHAWSEATRSAENPAPTTVAMGATMHQPGELDALVGQFDVVLIDAPTSQDVEVPHLSVKATHARRRSVSLLP